MSRLLRWFRRIFWRVVPHRCVWYGTGRYPVAGRAEECRCRKCGRPA